jgi:DSBA-like thioredoxin domain-containing protein
LLDKSKLHSLSRFYGFQEHAARILYGVEFFSSAFPLWHTSKRGTDRENGQEGWISNGPTTDAQDFLKSEQGRQEVLTEESWARRQGVQGVPFFLINGSAAISGAQRPELIAETLNANVTLGAAERG